MTMARGRQAVLHAGLAAGSLIVLFPFLWMLSLSLTREADIYTATSSLWPRAWTAGNYTAALTAGRVGTLMWNGVIVTLSILALQFLTSVPAAYVLATKAFRLRGLVFALVLGVLMVPPQVTAVPVYLLLSACGLVDTRLALVLPFATSAFGIFLLRQGFRTIPRELLDAARIDGASDVDILWSIAVPLCAPTLAAFAVFSVIVHWNDFFWPLAVVRSFEQATPPLGVAFFASDEGGYEIGRMMAAATLIVAPPMAAFLYARRWFIEGVTMSGIK